MRRRQVQKLKILPDAKYHDRLVTKFTNVLMNDGKKSVAEGILYGAFDIIAERYKADPMEVFKKALESVRPKLEVKSRRVGGATSQVPIEVRPERANSLAMRWLSLTSQRKSPRTTYSSGNASPRVARVSRIPRRRSELSGVKSVPVM